MILGAFILISIVVIAWAVYAAFLSPETSKQEKKLQKTAEELSISNAHLKGERERLTQQIKSLEMELKKLIADYASAQQESEAA